MFVNFFFGVNTIELVRNVRFVGQPKVLLIDESGTNLGEVDTHVALRKARDLGLDLILVNRSTTPPVCKLGNLGKLKYEAKRKLKENKTREQETKTLRIRPGTQKHDLDIEVRKATEFLKKGDRVRLECRFRNRELLVSREIGLKNIEYLVSELSEFGKTDSKPELVLRTISIVLSPK